MTVMDKAEPLKLFQDPFEARFLARPNRFLVECMVGRRKISAFLPNPGRLQELLLPNATLYVVKVGQDPLRKTSFTVVAVKREDLPIMLHTHLTNRVARHLIERRLVPGLERAEIVKAEITVGNSRFDFLLTDGRKATYLEVKSCTLVGKRIAMFPDAVTARGSRHLEELAILSQGGTSTMVLFVVHWPLAEVFMPDFHTDLRFAETLLRVRPYVDILPLAVRWRSDLVLDPEVRPLRIPWDYIEKEAKDRGAYLLLLQLRRDTYLDVGSLGRTLFRAGFYVYVGSAMVNLTARTERHKRMRKRHHWHIDTLRDVAELRTVLAIRSTDRLECDIANSMSEIAPWSVHGFGSSDCTCPSHLFGFGGDPVSLPSFQGLLQYYRMDRLTV
jgi:sugar fermentation stimulation protein A